MHNLQKRQEGSVYFMLGCRDVRRDGVGCHGVSFHVRTDALMSVISDVSMHNICQNLSTVSTVS